MTLLASTGEPIYAVHDGVLMYDYNSRMGNQAVMHNDGEVTTYSHMETVFPTGWYAEGDQIGTCGYRQLVNGTTRSF